MAASPLPSCPTHGNGNCRICTIVRLGAKPAWQLADTAAIITGLVLLGLA